MCMIGEKVKVNVVAPHFGEGKLVFQLESGIGSIQVDEFA